ncbi:MAG: hypothetical protein QNJ55_15805 [Xenococcus sp. MO_188.B8]|nr:hypothetical protein [Xenococcus sp. MO_188.B8]
MLPLIVADLTINPVSFPENSTLFDTLRDIEYEDFTFLDCCDLDLRSLNRQIIMQ